MIIFFIYLQTIGSKVVFLNKKVAEHGDVLIISVKPQVVDKILPEIKTCDKLIISIAAGTSIDNLEKVIIYATIFYKNIQLLNCRKRGIILLINLKIIEALIANKTIGVK